MSVSIIERLNSGLTYAEYLAAWRDTLKTPSPGMDKEVRKRLHYSRYNFERQERVGAQYEPSPEPIAASRSIDAPQMWMLLTDDWCGDSAYASPIIHAAAASADHVELRILRRDENLDLMDEYLTNGSRSIPKLVAFDMFGTELFRWGPRPAHLQRMRERLVEEGVEPREITRRLVAWFDEGNWIEIEEELAALVAESVVSPA